MANAMFLNLSEYQTNDLIEDNTSLILKPLFERLYVIIFQWTLPDTQEQIKKYNHPKSDMDSCSELYLLNCSN